MKRRSRMSQRSSASGSKYGIETRRRWSIYIGTCNLQISDGRMYFWETICSKSNSNDGCHFCKPHGFSNLYTKQRCRFFSFNFRGRRRSKKKCSSSIKVHGWGKLISRVWVYLILAQTGTILPCICCIWVLIAWTLLKTLFWCVTAVMPILARSL